ncbi:MAG: AAA family ATPase [Candidatus Carbobacillus sp.]|nr:AAA family ATPase [Candidatus Carbobacillus sp.]
MSDQAEPLRRLMQKQPTDPHQRMKGIDPKDTQRSRIIGWASGKGGVGKSNLVLSLSYALSEVGRRVLLIDADAGFGNLSLLMGEGQTADLMDVIEGRKHLQEVLVQTSGGFYYTSFAGTLEAFLASEDQEKVGKIETILQQLEGFGDVILLDFGAGLSSLARHVLAAVDELVLVITPEVTALSDAYVLYKWLYQSRQDPSVHVLVNRVQEEKEAEAIFTRFERIAFKYLGGAPKYLGFVREDPHVPQAVKRQVPFYMAYPRSAASRDIQHIRARLRLHWNMCDGDDTTEHVKGGMRGLLERLKGLVKRGEV